MGVAAEEGNVNLHIQLMQEANARFLDSQSVGANDVTPIVPNLAICSQDIIPSLRHAVSHDKTGDVNAFAPRGAPRWRHADLLSGWRQCNESPKPHPADRNAVGIADGGEGGCSLADSKDDLPRRERVLQRAIWVEDVNAVRRGVDNGWIFHARGGCWF